MIPPMLHNVVIFFGLSPTVKCSCQPSKGHLPPDQTAFTVSSGKEEDGCTKLGDIMSFSLDMHQHSSKNLAPYASVPLSE